MTIKKLDLGQIRNIFAILGIVLFIIYFPVNNKFAAVQKEIDILREDYGEHCENQEKHLKEFARLGETNIKLNQICIDLTRLFDELDKCQEQDEKLRETIQTLILKLPSK
jgi:hypothetical protein